MICGWFVWLSAQHPFFNAGFCLNLCDSLKNVDLGRIYPILVLTFPNSQPISAFSEVSRVRRPLCNWLGSWHRGGQFAISPPAPAQGQDTEGVATATLCYILFRKLFHLFTGVSCYTPVLNTGVSQLYSALGKWGRTQMGSDGI